MTLLALALVLALAPVQNCTVDLPHPTGSFSDLGDFLTASDAWVASSHSSSTELHLWQRTGGGDASFAATVTSSSGRIRSIDADGDQVAVLSGVSVGSYNLNVWEPTPAGAWAEGAALPIPAGRAVAEPISIEGDTIMAMGVAPSGGLPRRLMIFDRDPASGAWVLTEEVPNPGAGQFASDAILESGRILAMSGNFGNLRLQIFERAAGSFSLERELSHSIYNGFFDGAGDRIALPGGGRVDIWRRDPSGWVLEQTLSGSTVAGVVRVALEDQYLAASIVAQTQSGLAPRPVRIFKRAVGSDTWLATGVAGPPGSFGGTTDAFAYSLVAEGAELFVSDRDFAFLGRIIGADLACLQPQPVLHWASARLALPAASSWPSMGRTLDVSTAFSFDPGEPYGLRGARLDVVGDYVLDITGRACSQDYGSSVCAYAAFAFQDGITGIGTTPYPIDPEIGFPQMFSSGPGPAIPASASDVQIPWPFLFEGSALASVGLQPSGSPMDLQLAAQVYNCIDFGGIFVPDIPNVEAFGCGFQSIPASVTSLQFSATATAELAFNLPALAAGLQGTICDGGVNGAGLQASLEAVGSSVIAESALYFDVTGLIPGAAGILFLSPQAGTPPFTPLGFGSLCLGSPVTRVPGTLGIADASGNAALRLDLSTLSSGTQPQPGSTWAVQWMYRDQGFVNTSSARTITFQ